MELAFDKIEKSFGTHRVLDGISLVAESGKACGLLGRNGAGKTTAIRIMTDVLPADGGRILVDGKPIDYRTLKFGYLPEERGLYPKKKIIEQLVYFAQLKGMNTADATAASDRWLARLGMSEYRNRKLETLSKGNQQKIQLITALTHDPDIIILKSTRPLECGGTDAYQQKNAPKTIASEEMTLFDATSSFNTLAVDADERLDYVSAFAAPCGGLDPVNAKLLSDVVVEEIERGKIVFFSSHQMNYIEEFCEDIAILNTGRIAVSGRLRDIKRSYPRNRLEISGPEAKKVAADFAGSCKVTGDDAIILKLGSPDDKRQVMRALSEQYDLDMIKVAEPTLNDIFVEYADHDAEETK